MNYKVVGDRLLIKVMKVTLMKEKDSLIYVPDDIKDQETISQNIGEVVQIGGTAYTNPYDKTPEDKWVKVGDHIHFQRYGAIRLNPAKHKDCEYWVIKDKDVLVIENS